MERNEVHTLADLLEYCFEHTDSIFVRAEVKGQWGRWSLAVLSNKDRAKWIARFIEERNPPLRVVGG